MRFDTKTQQLALETRNQEELQAFFQVIDTDSGKHIVSDFRTQERWWTGLEDLSNGILLLHGYGKKQENGEHLGLQALEIESGKIVWANGELTYSGLISETEFLALNATGKIEKIDILSGKSEQFSAGIPEVKDLNQAFEKVRNQDLQFPEFYLAADTHYAMLQEFILQKTGFKASQTIEYKETSRAIILSFYVENGTVLANYLIVCALSGELLLQVCLQEKAVGQGLDTFFIFAEKLFFIQEKSIINGYLL